MGRKRDPELDSMTFAYYSVVIERLEMQSDEAEMKAALIEKMKAKKLTAYDAHDGEKK